MYDCLIHIAHSTPSSPARSRLFIKFLLLHLASLSSSATLWIARENFDSSQNGLLNDSRIKFHCLSFNFLTHDHMGHTQSQARHLARTMTGPPRTPPPVQDFRPPIFLVSSSSSVICCCIEPRFLLLHSSAPHSSNRDARLGRRRSWLRHSELHHLPSERTKRSTLKEPINIFPTS
jgi:hypothetical protein